MFYARPYKYELVAGEIISYLKKQKKLGCKTVTVSAKEIEHLLNVSERCGAKTPGRYPLVCQAMHKAAEKYPAVWVCGNDPGSTFTVEYRLRLF